MEELHNVRMAVQQAVEGDLEIQLFGGNSPMPDCIFLVNEFDGKYGLGAVDGCCFLYTTAQQSARFVERQICDIPGICSLPDGL